jgi:hypothetical protein
MKILLPGIFGLGLLVGSGLSALMATETFAAPPNTPPGLINNPGLTGNYAPGLVNNPNLNGARAVPIPGTLLLFGAGFAGFAAWNSRRTHQ